MNQARLAAELGISHIPLREALKQLEGEGYTEVRTYNGVYARKLHKAEMNDLYLVRREIEGLASGLALDKLTDRSVGQLQEGFVRMTKATKKLDYERLLKLNRSFHFTIYDACAREFLLELVENLWNRSARYRIMGTFHPKRATEALKEHRRMLDSCVSRDKRGLTAATRTNVENTRRDLAAYTFE